MVFEKKFWERYSDQSDFFYNEEFAKFIRDLAFSLRADKVLEVGCNVGNDLKAFPENFDAEGIDLCSYAIEKAKKNIPSFNFQTGSITNLPFDESSFDLVFTHRVLNFLDDSEIKKAIQELYRVSRKYILNCELMSDEGKKISLGNSNSQKIYEHWLEKKVKIISNVEMHEEIDPEKSRFILVRKL